MKQSDNSKLGKTRNVVVGNFDNPSVTCAETLFTGTFDELLKGDLFLSVLFAEQPDLGFELITGLDGAGEADGESLEFESSLCAGSVGGYTIVCVDGFEDCTGSESEGAETVEDGSTETDFFAQPSVDVDRVVVSRETVEHCLLKRGFFGEDKVGVAGRGFGCRRLGDDALGETGSLGTAAVEGAADHGGVVTTDGADETHFSLHDETVGSIVNGADALFKLPTFARDDRDGSVDLDAVLTMNDSVEVQRRETGDGRSGGNHLGKDGGVLRSTLQTENDGVGGESSESSLALIGVIEVLGTDTNGYGVGEQIATVPCNGLSTSIVSDSLVEINSVCVRHVGREFWIAWDVNDWLRLG